MKKFFFFLALTILTAGVLDSCTKDTSLSNSITGRRVDGTTYENIVTIKQQIEAIYASIADLETIRAEIRTLTEAKVAQGEDITALKTADKTLETRIAELKEYVENELKNYATTDWVKAGFATLEQHQKTQEALAETDAKIGSLDEKLTQAIREVRDNLTAQIETLSDRISALEEMIQSVTVVPAYNDGSVEVYGAVLTINCIVEPAAAVADLKADNVTVLVSKAKTKAISYEAVSVAKLIKDATKGELTIKADISNVTPAPNGQALMAALRFVSDITHYTTEFYPVYSESNVDVADGGDAPMITIKADPDMPHVVAGTVPVAESFKESKTTTIEVQGIGTVTFDETAAAKIKENAEGATNILLKIEDVTTTKPVKDADIVYEVTMKTYDETGTEVFSEGKEDGVVTLEIPLDDDVAYVKTVTLVDADGNILTGGVVPDSEKLENGILTFQVNHFSKYAVDYVKKSAYIGVTGVSLNKDTLNLTVGGNETLIATVSPANATDNSVRWSSSNTAVATVDANGKVTAVSTGTATITVTTKDGGKTATCAVTVTIPMAGVSLNKTELTLPAGSTETLIATITPADATNKNVTWSSSDEAVATVDANGKVTAVSAGTATITVTTEDGGKTATCAVTVSNPVVNVTGVTLNKNTMSLIVDDTEILIATITPENATNKNVTWSSSDEAVATVDANGKVTAVSAGTATITVTTEDGGKTATCAVTVSNPVVNVTGVTLNKNTMSLVVDDTEILIATITPENATNKNVTWSSSNTAVATMDNDGKVTAVSAGTATITVTTVDGGKTATCAVTVSNPVVNVTGVTLNKNTMSLVVDDTEILIATITPENATNKNVTWSSSDEAVATVGNDGTVTAVAAGTATITVTTEDGGKTATCAVTVTTPVTGVSLNKTALTLTVGGTETLVATITPADATNKNKTWSSSNTAVATVGNDGKVTAIATGTATITVTTEDGGKTATCAVTVNPRGDTDPYGHENW